MRTVWALIVVTAFVISACGSSGDSKESGDLQGAEVAKEVFGLRDAAAASEAEVAVMPGDTQGDETLGEIAGPLYPDCSKLLFKCILACDEASSTCEDDCKAQASKAAREGWDALAACGEAKCPAEMDAAGWVTCFGATCVTQFSACAGGVGKCKDVRGCADGCTPTDVNCVLECMSQGTADAMTAFSKLYACIAPLCADKTEPTAYHACIEGAYGHECSNLSAACEPH